LICCALDSFVSRRIAAIVLPQLACELVVAHDLLRKGSLGSEHAGAPFAVIVDESTGESPSNASSPDGRDSDAQDGANAILDAVDPRAWRYGARPGQSAAQASAYVGRLNVIRLPRALIDRALSHVAEIALAFGTTAALTLEEAEASAGGASRYPMGAGAGPHDTVWLDVSGCARLVGGEDLLCAELIERAQELGYRARIAIAGGPRLARAIARWKPAAAQNELIVTAADTSRLLADLPIAALPLDTELLSWLGKLGIFRIDDLIRLDRSRLAHRLGRRARDLLALISGHDDMPLVAYHPPRRIVELAHFERELSGTQPLLFVLRGLTSRAISRLAARGEACTIAAIVLRFDRSVIALSNKTRSSSKQLEDEVRLDLDLPVALSREDELLRALQVKVERLALPAPITSVELILDGLASRSHTQLDIGGKRGVDPNALPILLTELGAWVGSHRVGVLRLVDSHRPEAKSQLVPVALDTVSLRDSSKRTTAHNSRMSHLADNEPSRILPAPIEIAQLKPGALISARAGAAVNHSSGMGLYLIDHLRLSLRIDNVQWWSPSPVCRDYARAWLRTGIDAPSQHSSAERAEAWVYLDRSTGRSYLQGWYE
jgi:protein ImuB